MSGEKQRLFSDTGSGSIYSKLEFRAGRAYAETVMCCLNTARAFADENDGPDIQETALATLNDLTAAV